MCSSKVLKEEKGVKPLVLKTMTRTAHPADRVSAIERDAYERGFTAGEKAGFELGRKKAETIFRALSQIVTELEGFREELLSQLEKDITKLAIAIARKVIECELSVREDIVVNAVKSAIELTGRASSIVVRLNGADVEVIKRYLPELEQYTLGTKKIVLREDPSVGRGGCMVETENTTIEHTIDTALKEIEERLKDVSCKDKGKPE